MFDGRLVQIDSPETLYAKPCNREVASFIGEMNFLPAAVKSDSDGKLSITTACFAGLRIDRNPNVSKRGASITVGIRPEQLELSANEPTGYDATAQGKIRDIAFYGENVHYHVQVEGLDKPMVVSVPNYFHTVDFHRGDKVWLGVQNASMIDLGQDNN